MADRRAPQFSKVLSKHSNFDFDTASRQVGSQFAALLDEYPLLKVALRRGPASSFFRKTAKGYQVISCPSLFFAFLFFCHRVNALKQKVLSGSSRASFSENIGGIY